MTKLEDLKNKRDEAYEAFNKSEDTWDEALKISDEAYVAYDKAGIEWNKAEDALKSYKLV